MSDTAQKEAAFARLIAKALNENLASKKADVKDLRGDIRYLFSRLPKEKVGELEKALAETRKYAKDPEAERLAITTVYTKELQDTKAMGLGVHMGGLLKLGFPKEMTHQQFLDALEAEIAKPTPITVPDMPGKDVPVITPAQRVNAMDTLLARKLDEDLKKGGNPDISVYAKAQIMAFYACQSLPGETGVAFREKIKKTGDTFVLLPDMRDKAMVALVREGMELARANADKIGAVELAEMERGAMRVLDPRSRDAGAHMKAVIAEIDSPSKAPKPDAPKMPENVQAPSSAAWIDAYNKVMAREIDENYKSGGKKYSTDALRKLGSSATMETGDFEITRLNTFLRRTSKITDKGDELKAATRISREVLQRAMDVGKLSDKAAADLQSGLQYAVKAQMPELEKLIAEEMKNPSPKALPPIPDLPANNEWMRLDAKETTELYRDETNSPARMERAVKDLTARHKPADGGWNDRGVSSKVGTWNKEKNAYVVTYTFDTKEMPASYPKKPGEMVRKLNDDQKKEALRAMKDISKVANVIFEEAPADKANLLLGQASITASGYANYHHPSQRPVVVSDTLTESMFGSVHGTWVHEFLHGAAGISHPGETGEVLEGERRNPDYRLGTAMTYNALSDNGVPLYDVAALQKVFGPPLNIAGEPVFTPVDLREVDTIYAREQGVVDFRSEGKTVEFVSGRARINLSPHIFITDQFRAEVEGKEVGQHAQLHKYVAEGTKLEVLADNATNIRMDIIGMAGKGFKGGAARFQGGAQDDVLTARGGNNVLTGNKGADQFVFDRESGRDNVITDFNAKEKDTLVVRAGFSNVNIKTAGADTLVTMTRKGDEKATATVLIKNATPEQVKSATLVMSCMEAPPTMTVEAPKEKEKEKPKEAEKKTAGTMGLPPEQIKAIGEVVRAVAGIMGGAGVLQGQTPEHVGNGLAANAKGNKQSGIT